MSRGRQISGLNSVPGNGKMPSMKVMMAECDARTLAEAEAIRKDTARLKAAGKAAEVIKKEAEDTAKGFAKIARHGKK